MIRCPQVTKNLPDMLIDNRSAGFHLDNQAIFNHQIHNVIPECSTIIIVDAQRFLLIYFYPHFPQTVGQSVFVYPLKMTVAQIGMQFKSRLTDEVTQI